jgi:HSP20 family molecular chaperone IbpA
MRAANVVFVAACLALAVHSANAFGVTFSGTVPSHSILRSFGPDFDAMDGLNDLRDSMRDVLEFADRLAMPAFEASERKNHQGITEVKKNGGSSHHELRLRPRFDIQESKEGFMLMATMPGLRKEDLSIEIINSPEGQLLEISGGSPNTSSRDPSPSRDAANTQQPSAPKLRTAYAKFERRIRLPPNVDTSTLQAKYEDGLLVVTMSPLAKKDTTQRQKIAIQ